MGRLFGKLKMRWTTVLLFAVIAGVYTGLIMQVPALKDTSFQDIGIGYEWWVIFAVIVVVNCEKNWEAMLKCFVFFLVSQPLVYAVEVLCGGLSAAQGRYYYRTIWLPMTFLTLPGGFVAYYCKKQNAFGSLILGIGNTIQLVMALSYLGESFGHFPHHILSALVALASVFVMTFYIQKEKRLRLIALAVPIGLTVIILIFAAATGRTIF